MTTRLTLPTPTDYLLHRDLCSYGYFLLAPNHWTPESRTFRTTLDPRAAAASFKPARTHARAGAAVTITVQQRTTATKRGKQTIGQPLMVRADRTLSLDERALIKDMLVRMLRLDEPAHKIAAFHKVDPRWAASMPRRATAEARTNAANSAGRGRLMRSPSFFEDVIKTVTSCNVTWPSTIIMNKRICEVAGARSVSGHAAFPTPERLARVRPATLRARCSVGYRDARIIELARMFALGRKAVGRPRAAGLSPDRIDSASFEDAAAGDEAIFNALIQWPGIGPYAAANIMQLLGRYSRLPLDTESVRHGRTVLGMKGAAPAIMRRIDAHFKPFGEHKFRSYWFELWSFYEARRGPAWTWERETIGKTFTAALLK